MWLPFLAYFTLPDNDPLKQLKCCNKFYSKILSNVLVNFLTFQYTTLLTSFNSKCGLGYMWRDSTMLPAINTCSVRSSWDPLIVNANLSTTVTVNNGAWGKVLWETNLPFWNSDLSYVHPLRTDHVKVLSVQKERCLVSRFSDTLCLSW